MTEESENSVYDRLKALLVSRSFVPGERLHVSELADRLKVSATPVREALSRLWAEEHVAVVPHRGFFVKKLDQREIADLYVMKHAILTYACRGAVASAVLDEAERHVLEVLASPLGGRREEARHAAIYERCLPAMSMLIAALSGNVVMLDCLHNVLDRLHFVRHVEISMDDRAEKVLQEAATLARGLLDGQEDLVLEILDKQLQRELSMLETLVRECIACLYDRDQATTRHVHVRQRVQLSLLAV